MTLAVPPATTLSADSPLWVWAQDAIDHRLEEMLAPIEGVRLGEDIEAVHDMRVGSRRLVAAMKVFAACFPGHAYQLLAREARMVTRRLGAVRDLDVLLDHYVRLRVEAPPEEQLGIDYFLAVHRRERERARRPLLAALRKIQEDHLADRLRRFLQDESDAYRVGLHAPVGAAAAVDPAGSFRRAATPILEDRLHILYRFERYVEDPEETVQLHEMRIAAKWLRYTMELFAPAYANALKGQINAVKQIQELLGDLHDSDVRLEILGGMLESPPDFRGLEALGILLPDPVIAGLALLLVREQRTRRRCYEAFRKEWRKLSKKDFASRTLSRIHQPDGA